MWTTPTAAGETAIDPFHPLARVKRLAGKPLERFEGRCAGNWWWIRCRCAVPCFMVQ